MSDLMSEQQDIAALAWLDLSDVHGRLLKLSYYKNYHTVSDGYSQL